MEKEPFRIGNGTDPTDEELQQIMEDVGVLIREETEKCKKIHEQRLKEIFSKKES